jgi:hypothetical protein
VPVRDSPRPRWRLSNDQQSVERQFRSAVITVRPTLIRGTDQFVDRVAVVRYLRAAHPDLSPEELIDLATEKETSGKIKVGKPPLSPGEELTLMENGTRWGIISAGTK